MDLSKVSNAEKLNLCRWYFRGKYSSIYSFIKAILVFQQFIYCSNVKAFRVNIVYFLFYLLAGIAFLPIIWAVNAVWFFDEAFRKPAYEEQKSIKKCMYTFRFYLFLKFVIEILHFLLEIVYFSLRIIYFLSLCYFFNELSMSSLNIISSLITCIPKGMFEKISLNIYFIVKFTIFDILMVSDVIYSGVGAISWAVFVTSWVVVFQLNRAAWGEFADNISFIIPVGTP